MPFLDWRNVTRRKAVLARTAPTSPAKGAAKDEGIIITALARDLGNGTISTEQKSLCGLHPQPALIPDGSGAGTGKKGAMEGCRRHAGHGGKTVSTTWVGRMPMQMIHHRLQPTHGVKSFRRPAALAAMRGENFQ